MEQLRTYKDLNAWKNSRELVKEIYEITKSYPREEIYSLTAQIRRCTISVSSNIAEGMGRQHLKETIQFLYLSRGSLYELETQLILSGDLGFISTDKLEKMLEKLEIQRKLISGLITYNKKRLSLPKE